jgi:hypothetical protein
MSKFDRVVTFRAKCPEFTAELTPKSGNLWHAVIRFKDGRVFGQTYSDRAAMERDLDGRSDYQVNFIQQKEQSDISVMGGKRSGVLTVEDAKQSMLDSNEGRKGLGEVRTNVPTASAGNVPMARFSPEDLATMSESIFEAFKAMHAEIYESNAYNDPVIRQAIKDFDCLHTVENYQAACVWLLDQNMLVPVGGRKRGSPPIAAYRSTDRIIKDARVSARDEEQARAAELRKLPLNDPDSLDKIRDAVKAENPNLGNPNSGRKAIYTEGHSRGPVERSAEEQAARDMSFETLQSAEKARQAELRNKKPRTYEW